MRGHHVAQYLASALPAGENVQANGSGAGAGASTLSNASGTSSRASSGSSKKALELDARQAARAAAFDERRHAHFAFVEGLVKAEEGAVAVWLDEWARSAGQDERAGDGVEEDDGGDVMEERGARSMAQMDNDSTPVPAPAASVAASPSINGSPSTDLVARGLGLEGGDVAALLAASSATSSRLSDGQVDNDDDETDEVATTASALSRSSFDSRSAGGAGGARSADGHRLASGSSEDDASWRLRTRRASSGSVVPPLKAQASAGNLARKRHRLSSAPSDVPSSSVVGVPGSSRREQMKRFFRNSTNTAHTLLASALPGGAATAASRTPEASLEDTLARLNGDTSARSAPTSSNPEAIQRSPLDHATPFPSSELMPPPTDRGMRRVAAAAAAQLARKKEGFLWSPSKPSTGHSGNVDNLHAGSGSWQK